VSEFDREVYKYIVRGFIWCNIKIILALILIFQVIKYLGEL